MKIQLGGTGGPAGCGNDDQVDGNNESLEGSDGPDLLIGDSGENSFLGHKGADTFLGKGGTDFIDALDGSHDKSINCGGGGGDDILKDKVDPTRSPAEPQSSNPSSPTSGTNRQGPISALT